MNMTYVLIHDAFDWINTMSQAVMALTTVIMGVLAYKTYLESPNQKDVSDEPNTSVKGDDYHLMEDVVFNTSKQTTTLKVTNLGLECHLDDWRAKKGGLQWIISKEDCKRVLENNMYSVNPGSRALSGRFNIGRKRNWLYSKRLFPEPDYLKGVLKELLTNAADQNTN